MCHCLSMSLWLRAEVYACVPVFAQQYRHVRIHMKTAIKQPYNVNVAAEAMARAALQHRDKILVTVRSLAAELQKTVDFCQNYKYLKPYPTHSNFVLCEGTS